MELRDTVDGMLSEDYEERFKAELDQLEIRCAKLDKTVEDWDAGQLGFEPKCSRELLMAQLGAMTAYANVLLERARAEGIDVSR